jgi:hypothetical protein
MLGVYPDNQRAVDVYQLRDGRAAHNFGPTDLGQALMSMDRLRLINRCLGGLLIALYIALGFTAASDLLPDSAIAMLLNGSEKH